MGYRRSRTGGQRGIVQTSKGRTPEQCRNRLKFLLVVPFCFSAVICWRLFDLQETQHDKWSALASKQYRTGEKVQGARGSIYDRNGRALAVSVEALAVGAHPKKLRSDLQSPVKLTQLADVLDLEVPEVEKVLAKDKSFLWLARGVLPQHRSTLKAISPRGLSVFSEFKRYYPQGSVAGSLLGTLGRDGRGLSGIELMQNKRLTAPSYHLALRRDARGNYLARAAWQGAAADEDTRPIDKLREEGNAVVLSIDAAMQGIIEREFAVGAKEAKAKRVFGLVMDAETGNILAMAQNESFNPNQQGTLSPAKLRNVVLQDAFEPGSTFKPIVAAIALDEGVVSAEEILDCENGRYRVGRHTVRDIHPVKKVQLRDVLVRSSNICMAKLGQRLGKERFHHALTRFGIGRRTGVELPGEAAGILRSSSKWRTIDLATHAFGQGVAVTAIQLVQSYAVLANGGFLVQPTLFHSEKSPMTTRIIKTSTANQIRDMIQGVIHDEHGTARRARIAGVTVHGKTGTAQKAKLDGRGYEPDAVLSSFIGFVDGQKVGVAQKLVMLVVVDEPGVKPRWGGRVAAPIFRRSMERILSHMMSLQGNGLRTAFHTGQEAKAAELKI